MRLMSVALLAAPLMSARTQDHAHAQSQPQSLGSVHFQTSCASAVAPTFDQGVALLHSFEFGAAIRTFNEVLARDSTCAMAHWGIALSRWSNPMSVGDRTPSQLQSGRLSADAANRLGSRATAREREYIAAVGKLYENYEHVDQRTRVVAYERTMGELTALQPADTEAKIFHAIALVASAPASDKTYANQLRAGATLEALWQKQPNHPGLAHYIIHAYDVPALAPQAQAAARRYSEIAPSAAHALHMPSHTFTRTGQWTESVQANRRSIAVAMTTGGIGESLHASDYMEYAYLQMAQDSSARAILSDLPTLAQRLDVTAITGAANGAAGVFAIAAIPARFALERRAWSEAAALEAQATQFPWSEAMTYFARALGASHTGDFAKAHASVDSLASIGAVLTARGERYWAEQVAIQWLTARAWLELAEHHADSAVAHMRDAARREDATEKSAVTPGPLAPAGELLGDMLMELKRPAEALAEYQATLTKEPNRFRTLYGAMRAASAAGDPAAAKFRRDLRELCARADASRAEVRELRNQ